MSSWFSRNFGNVGNVVADIRHEILGGWFGRNFEPHPIRQQGHGPAELGRDVHGNDREHGVDLER